MSIENNAQHEAYALAPNHHDVTLSAIMLASTAISQKRIADALEKLLSMLEPFEPLIQEAAEEAKAQQRANRPRPR